MWCIVRMVLVSKRKDWLGWSGIDGSRMRVSIARELLTESEVRRWGTRPRVQCNDTE